MEQYFRVPNKIFNLPLSASETLVLIYLLRCSNNGNAFPSYTTIAHACKINRSTAIRCIRNLKPYLYISRPNHSVNHYKVVLAGGK